MNKEQEQFLRDNAKGKSIQELADLLNNEFNTNYTAASIKHYKKRFGIKSGRFTAYQKGRIPHNRKPVGSERVDKEGYTHIKIAEPDVWTKKQRYVYEKHYGKIPEGHSVVFADGDKTNFEIDNLVLMDNKCVTTMYYNNLFYKDKELNETGYLIAQILNKKYEIKKEEINERIRKNNGN